ncbi:hypothetical protein AAFF_G00042630 [Aldrovandia affinis]|uniref:Uncharacterized protein n=1 Tax=Aldrovandia affinis TaxID=143900 RepID=A0AAD7R243_9TELE|nr:hypothetical protein AAFF_G00042630 [Aldrovandia affinis]
MSFLVWSLHLLLPALCLLAVATREMSNIVTVSNPQIQLPLLFKSKLPKLLSLQRSAPYIPHTFISYCY